MKPIKFQRERPYRPQTRINQTVVKHPCPVCSNNDYTVHECNSFSKLTIEEKYEAVISKRLCLICLGEGHMAFRCLSRIPDKSVHHTFIHRDNEPSSSNTARIQEETPLPTEQANLSVNTFNTFNEHVLLAAALVRNRSYI